MQLKIPKSDKYEWTQHSMYKMQQYGLSPQRVVRVIRNPQRVEEGVVENTVAVMQPAAVKFKDGKKTWSQEIWSMYQVSGKSPKTKAQSDIKNLNTSNLIRLIPKKLKIISAWRYPGVSPKNNPIPEEILRELQDMS